MTFKNILSFLLKWTSYNSIVFFLRIRNTTSTCVVNLNICETFKKFWGHIMYIWIFSWLLYFSIQFNWMFHLKLSLQRQFFDYKWIFMRLENTLSCLHINNDYEILLAHTDSFSRIAIDWHLIRVRSSLWGCLKYAWNLQPLLVSGKYLQMIVCNNT